MMRCVAERGSGVRRYALVLNDSNNGLRRFHLARVASAPAAQRLERMEDVAEREREGSVTKPENASGNVTDPP
jgi:hypothetical protein